jgi:hypothetical protein
MSPRTGPDDLSTCQYCGRQGLPERIADHEQTCDARVRADGGGGLRTFEGRIRVAWQQFGEVRCKKCDEKVDLSEADTFFAALGTWASHVEDEHPEALEEGDA